MVIPNGANRSFKILNIGYNNIRTPVWKLSDTPDSMQIKYVKDNGGHTIVRCHATLYGGKYYYSRLPLSDRSRREKPFDVLYEYDTTSFSERSFRHILFRHSHSCNTIEIW